MMQLLTLVSCTTSGLKKSSKRLWIMYHEFGHDVYKYEHSTDPADINIRLVPK